MQLYFNSTAAGGSGDGNFHNVNNFWQDSSWTIPNGQASTLIDDVQLDDFIGTSSGSTFCHDITSSNQVSFDIQNLNSTQLTIYGTIIGVNLSAPGNLGIIIPNSGPLLLSGCGINHDYNFGGSINGSAGCSYNINCAANITDDGSGTFTNSTYTGTIIYPGTLSTGTFGGNVTVTSITGGVFNGFGAAINCNTITGGTFSGPVTVNQTGDVTLTGTSSLSYLNWMSITSIQAATLGGSVVSFTPTFPNVQDVDDTQTSGPSQGTLTRPTAAQVQSGVVYGVGGNGSTGTLTSGSGTQGFGG